MAFMKLRLGHAEVDVYSHRSSGAPPTLHLVSVSSGRGDRPRRALARQLLSHPVCAIVPLADGSYALRQPPPRGVVAAATTIELGAVVFAAFDLLIREYGAL
jgi:hypothetical protein